MSVPSPSPDAHGSRLARTLGVVALVVVQGGWGLALLQLHHLEQASERSRPSRAAARRELERMGPAAVTFLSASGTVESFGDDELVVMDTNGIRVRVRIDRDTLVMGRRQPAELSDLYPGIDVAVSGAVEPDGAIMADVVQVEPL